MAPTAVFSNTRSPTTIAPRTASSRNSAAMATSGKAGSGPPALESANHGIGLGCGVVPAGGETDAQTNGYHETVSRRNTAAGARINRCAVEARPGGCSLGVTPLVVCPLFRLTGQRARMQDWPSRASRAGEVVPFWEA